jgi:thiol:disulfide interchange protein
MKILFFTADDCPACQPMKEKVMELARIAGVSEVEVVNRDWTAWRSPKDNKFIKYGVQSIPTTIIIDDRGEELNRIVGNVGAPTIAEVIFQNYK